jgi:hypothetical protein
VETLNFVDANGLSGNVFAYYGWGGYVQLRTQGRLKVFIDGRAETAFSSDTYTDYLTVLDRKPGWIDVIESSGADFVLWPRWQAKDVANGPRAHRPLALALPGLGLTAARANDHGVARPAGGQPRVRLPAAHPRRDRPAGATARSGEASPRASAADRPRPAAGMYHPRRGGAARRDVTGATATATRCTSRYPDHDRDEHLRPIFERLRAARDGPG